MPSAINKTNYFRRGLTRPSRTGGQAGRTSGSGGSTSSSAASAAPLPMDPRLGFFIEIFGFAADTDGFFASVLGFVAPTTDPPSLIDLVGGDNAALARCVTLPPVPAPLAVFESTPALSLTDLFGGDNATLAARCDAPPPPPPPLVDPESSPESSPTISVLRSFIEPHGLTAADPSLSPSPSSRSLNSARAALGTSVCVRECVCVCVSE
jgi:hypothetical protein